MTTTMKLAELLHTKYLGVATFIRLSFTHNKRRFASLDIYAHHGKGGSGRLVGSSLNNVQNMGEMAEADIYLMGDNHKKIVGTQTRFRLTQGKGGINKTDRKIFFVRTGSFLESYQDGKVSYVADACLSPSDLGLVKLELTPKRKRYKDSEDRTYIDIHASL